MNNIFYTDKIKKKNLTRKRKRNENSNSNISAPQFKRAKIILQEVENEIKDLEDTDISTLFNKLSFKNSKNSKNSNLKKATVSRAAKAAITRKLNILKEKEKALQLILKARTRSELRKLLENKK
jgi:hypothetical protein